MNQGERRPIDYAMLCADTVMKLFPAAELPPKGRFHYHQGVLLSGFERTFHYTNKKEYAQYIKEWTDSLIAPDGSVVNYRDYELDGMMAGILLFDLYEKTGDERYKRALDLFIDNLKNWKLTPDGGLWHMLHHTNQMWLDGFYMASPLLVRYALRFGEDELLDTACRQMLLMWEHMRDEKTGLLYHAWDQSKQAPWRDRKTGLSAVFWGRAMGWYAVAAVDIAAMLPPERSDRQKYIDIACALLQSLSNYQEPQTGLWYQVVDRGERPDNWLESSCSALYTYALAKAVRCGWLGSNYRKTADKGYQGVIQMMETDGETYLHVPRICVGTCLGDYKFYVNRPVQTDMLIGVGAFLLMCNEYQLLSEQSISNADHLR